MPVIEQPEQHIYQPPTEAVIDVHYQDGWLLVVEKPAGLLSVPGRGPDKQDSLIRRVQLSYPEALVAHRLDMDTSGLMVLARDKETQRRLGRQFQERRVQKGYLALVSGRLQKAGVIELPLICDWPRRPLQKVDPVNGKPAVTRYRALDYDARADATRVLLQPETGRTHQLRVHMQRLGHPILGDRLYSVAGHSSHASRLCLHACDLSFRHPHSGTQLAFHSSAPF